LIRCERLDRLALRRSERGNRRSDEAHSQALRRLELLLHHSGGIYFGSDLKTQLRLASPNARIRARQLVTLRFCCQGWCFAFWGCPNSMDRSHATFNSILAGFAWRSSKETGVQ
jgi:ferric-dicitrate binding protein FerR (iron transport regulator)